MFPKHIQEDKKYESNWYKFEDHSSEKRGHSLVWLPH